MSLGISNKWLDRSSKLRCFQVIYLNLSATIINSFCILSGVVEVVVQVARRRGGAGIRERPLYHLMVVGWRSLYSSTLPPGLNQVKIYFC